MAQRREFKLLADAAGKTRDWDILMRVLVSDESMKLSVTSLIENVERCRANALIGSRAAIDSAGVDRLLRRHVHELFDQLQAKVFDVTLASFASKRVDAAERALKERMRRALVHQIPEYSELHQLRIAGKKLRYLLEFFLPVLGSRSQKSIEILTGLQDDLGNLNDIVASETLLHRYATSLGDSTSLEQAMKYLSEQKAHHMQITYGTLHVVGDAYLRAGD
ncbi:CHAD domain-containing protein [Paraburkholderia bryophila]|uniref:CHAD domain-containing protein n=1 Tax=Paraburkholderia bryophila TaxID=420952 RepID=UPI002349A558|nr:CHAD domain-containing protein [Paraburkholderia bryophila]WCM18306.1 CHAD domain-containing protein [Paraburkholderia bryophila]